MDYFNQDNLGGFGGDFDVHVESTEDKATRTARKQLENLAGHLQNRQQAVMQALNLNTRCGMASGSAGGFGFQDCSFPADMDRAAGMAMNRLKSYGLINHRFGSMNAGFFELDLATETPARIVGKCLQYQTYYRGNTEQRKYGVFPLVVWIVPNERRQSSLREHIRQCAGLQHKNLFTVILPDELEFLVTGGAEEYLKNLTDDP